MIPQNSVALSSCSTNSMAYVGTPSLANCENNPCRNLVPRFLHCNDRADQQVPMQLDGCSMLIQVGSPSRHSKGTFLSVLTRQPDRAVERKPSAPALSQLNADQALSGR